MPHWVEVKLAKPARVNRVIVRFADPMDYATSFEIQVKAGSAYQKVGGVNDNRDTRSFNAEFAPVETDTVKLLIRRAANSQSPNAVQVSELEVYGAN